MDPSWYYAHGKNAAKWVQVQKRKEGLGTWDRFMNAIEEKFGAYDYIHALNDLLELKQTGSVEDYATEFEDLQFQVEMHSSGYDTVFFIAQFTRGLKPEISVAVQSQLPGTMERAVILAKIQQQLMEKTKYRFSRGLSNQRFSNSIAASKQDSKAVTVPSPLTKERQKRDYCKATTCATTALNSLTLPILLSVPRDQGLISML
jgi:hypothetical protein